MGILCAGEILYDFISKSPNKGLGESDLFEKRPGGSPFNVAIGLSKLGAEVSFLTKIGTDEFGKSLFNYLVENGVKTDCILSEEGLKTTLAFAAVDENGKAEYEFYRDNAADVNLRMEDIEKMDFNRFSLFHFGSIALLEEPSSSTLFNLFEMFNKRKVVTSFDPNIRKSMIKDEKSYFNLVKNIISNVDILKLSDDDLFYITKENNIEEALKLLEIDKKSVVFVTLGDKGSLVYKQGENLKVDGYRVKVVDTVGCGDSFMAAILFKLGNFSKEELMMVDLKELGNVADFANKCAALVATRQGAANAMPTLAEVNNFHS